MISIDRLEHIQPYASKREKKYILLWCTSGNLLLRVDDKKLRLAKNELLTITSGQYFGILEQNKAMGFMLDFTLDFFCKTDHDIELVFQNGLFCHFDENEMISISNPERVSQILEVIFKEFFVQPYQYLISIHSYISLLLVEINRARITNGYEIWKPEALFLRFLELVRNDFGEFVSLKELAQKLGTTISHLNELSKRYTGKTALNVIFGLQVSEAKRLMYYENLLMKEVAQRIGFEDQYYFSKFFKKQTGYSPTAYLKTIAS